ncbi:MAG: DNA-formamidopyrimidine glycosylase family protein [Candidatus Latescibacterota bacterium]
MPTGAEIRLRPDPHCRQPAMPELPDICAYLVALERHVAGQVIAGVDLKSPFLVRSWEPRLETVVGRRVQGFRRLGKRVVWEVEGEVFLVFHLMIAGRYHWKKPGARPRTRGDLLALHFAAGTLMVTEASSQKRASLYLVAGEAGLAEYDPGGLEVPDCALADFRTALLRGNHTLKRALTDPHTFSGIGNAYSDEILHAARLSPVTWTSRLTHEQVERLWATTRDVLARWTERLCAASRQAFPEKVTAFRDGMAVHGRYGLPCPACGTAVQKIAYASNETNYCPRCQTDGRLLADRELSRLLRGDWPQTIEELEERQGRRGQDPAGGPSPPAPARPPMRQTCARRQDTPKGSGP